MQMVQRQRQLQLRLLWVLLTVGICLFFAFKTLAAIPLTSLWNDELRTVEKSFQPSLQFLFRYLRQDVHPPLYYGVLWAAGKLFGETASMLRSFSWLCYVMAALVMASACWSWGRSPVAAAMAAAIGLALPFTVRYAVEGKAYAMVYALIAWATLFRIRYQRGEPTAAIPCVLCWSAAALTHYYGFGLLLAQAALDGLRRRPTFRPLAWALVLPTLWMLGNLPFLLGSRGRDWIPPASAGLLLRLLRMALGVHWPLVLLVGGLTILILRWGRTTGSPPVSSLFADWGLDAGLLLLVASFLVSMVKPSAVDRYYIVLVPACMGVLSCWLGAQVADATLGPWRRALMVTSLAFVLVLFWSDSYRLIAPPTRSEALGTRKGHDFRTLSLIAAPDAPKISPQCRQLNAYDHLLDGENMLKISASWGCLYASGAEQQAARHPVLPRSPGTVVTLAYTGRPAKARSELDPALDVLKSQGFRCVLDQRSTPSAQVFRCRIRDRA